MNLQGSELSQVPQNILNQLQDTGIPVDVSSILDLLPIPDLGGLTETFKGLLSQNLTTINTEGFSELLNPVALQDALKQGLEGVKGAIEQEIKGVLDQAMSVANEVTSTAQSIASTISNIGQAATSLNFEFFNNALTQFIGIAGTMGVDTTQIAQLQGAVSPVLDSISNLSPKQLRDLQDPAKYQEFLNQAVNTATTLVGDQAVSNALLAIAPSLNIQTLLNLTKEGVGVVPNANDKGEYEVLVEIQTYYAKGEGADIDAARKKSVTGRQLQSGKSCAVDNAKIMFGSEVQTSLGTFTAVDKAKAISTSGLPVVGLFFETQQEAAEKDIQLTASGKRRQVVKVKTRGFTYKPKNIETRGTDTKLF
jgi:hypothetical protein